MNAKLAEWGGWLTAAGLASFGLLSGFKATSNKVGVLNLQTIATQSDFGKAAEAKIKQTQQLRTEVLKFLQGNPVMTSDQANQLIDLSLKDAQSPTDVTTLNTLKATITKQNADFAALRAKATLSTEEKTTLDNDQQEATQVEQALSGLVQQFQQDLTQIESAQREAIETKARAAAQTVAKQQGFTVVYDTQIAPYGANDISAATIQAMNASK